MDSPWGATDDLSFIWVDSENVASANSEDGACWFCIPSLLYRTVEVDGIDTFAKVNNGVVDSSISFIYEMVVIDDLLKLSDATVDVVSDVTVGLTTVLGADTYLNMVVSNVDGVAVVLCLDDFENDTMLMPLDKVEIL